MFDDAVAQILRDQYGLITREQAMGAGLTKAQIRYRVKKGEWLRAHWGVYRHSLMPQTFHSELMLGVLAVGGVVSHRSAARLHRFDELGLDARAEVVVDHGHWRPVGGLTVHQTTQIGRLDMVTIEGLHCTGKGRTVLDLGVSMNVRRLGKVVDALLRDKRITQGELWDVLIRHSVQGRNGCGPLRAVLDQRLGEERLALSDWSYAVANLLESDGLPRPKFEFRAHDDDGRFLGQVDLAFPSAMLAIELDSVGFHHNLDSFHGDRSRLRQLAVAGWTVLQFTWKDYSQDPDGLIRQVRGILSRESVTQ